MKKLAMAILLMMLAGCETMSPMQSYRPVGDNALWRITGEFNHFNGDIKILIDGNVVIADSLSVWSLEGELVGEYKDRSVSATCKQVVRLFSSSYEECFVYVDSENAAVLRFNSI